LLEQTINNLIQLASAGKVRHQPFPIDLIELIPVCERHAHKDLAQASPWLPTEQQDWSVSEVWKRVLHTDILVNSSGWIVAISLTSNPSQVDYQTRKLGQVSNALSRLQVDRAIAILVHHCEHSPKVSWHSQLENLVKVACTGDNFVSDGELFF
jgi:hypothetical protein